MRRSTEQPGRQETAAAKRYGICAGAVPACAGVLLRARCAGDNGHGASRPVRDDATPREASDGTQVSRVDIAQCSGQPTNRWYLSYGFLPTYLASVERWGFYEPAPTNVSQSRKLLIPLGHPPQFRSFGPRGRGLGSLLEFLRLATEVLRSSLAERKPTHPDMLRNLCRYVNPPHPIPVPVYLRLHPISLDCIQFLCKL